MFHARTGRRGRRMLVVGAWALSLAAVAAASAAASGMITGAQIEDGTVTGADVKNGSVGWGDLSSGARTRLINRAVAKAQATAGPSSAAAPAPGAAGAKGDKGDKGDTGAAGANGTNGVDAPAHEYGIAHVWVERGASASPWGSYSTTLAQGDLPAVTGGEFRFTCNKPTCKVYVTASVASDSSAADAKFQAHLQFAQTEGPIGTTFATRYCEASEVGATFAPIAIPRVALTDTSFAASVTSPAPRVAQGWGSADCDNGDVNGTGGTEYVVKEGRYNVGVTARFYR